MIKEIIKLEFLVQPNNQEELSNVISILEEKQGNEHRDVYFYF